MSQSFLQKCYSSLSVKETEKLAYQNCYSFIYHIEHGLTYFKQVELAPKQLHPILIFYGMTQLMKACILTHDPLYPENSQVLAHGVTTRKRKKTQYVFLQDEVKLQKNGLLTHFSSLLFQFKHITGDKYKMKNLLLQIPELHPLFSFNEKKSISYELNYNQPGTLQIPKKILDSYNLSESSFFHFISSRSSIVKEVIPTEDDQSIHIRLTEPLNNLHASPFLFHSDGSFYLFINKENHLPLPELTAHYLILYNLSMICRYETEWWAELFRYYPETDYPYINEFLQIAKLKVPLLVSQYLDQQWEKHQKSL
nr:YaaC family protein [Bacillus alkalicellulosilyticus]